MGCSSSDDGGSSDEFIRANVETISFSTAARPDAVTASKIESTMFTTLLVQGVSDEATSIVFVINEYDGVGTYNLSFSGDSNGTSGLYASLEGAWSSNGGTGGTGTITIDLDDATEVAGAFEFVGVQADNTSSSRSITNGRFRAQLEN